MLRKVLSVLLLVCAGIFPVSAADAPLRYMVALDFASSFDNGALGKQAGRMLRFKAARGKLYSVDNELDWEDLVGLLKFSGKVDNADKFMETAAKAYGCDVLICGDIAQVKPDGRALDVKVWAFDLKQRKQLVYREFKLGTNFELSQALDEVIKELTGAPTRADIAAADPSNRQEAFGPNLIASVVQGSTAEITSAVELRQIFKGWDFPFDSGIKASFSATGKYQLEYKLSKNIAYGTGLFCYSPYVSIKPGVYYQVSFRVKTDAPSVIQFTKCYRKENIPGYTGIDQQKKEVFKHQVRLHEDAGQWHILRSKPFLPRAADGKDVPVLMRVQLYTYLKPGVVRFTDVEIHECREKK